MIYYFSGTGNSEWVAKKLANNLNDEAINIVDFLKNNMDNILVSGEDSFGLVFPIYSWSVPWIIGEFLEKVNIDDGAFTYAVGTCAENAGLAFKKLSQVIRLDSSYSIVMPNNYIIGGHVDTIETINRKTNLASSKIMEISNDIKEKNEIYDVVEGTVPSGKSDVFNKFVRDTHLFWVEDTCNGCGLCQNNCPTGCIELKDKNPVWNGICYQCLSCINRCPKQAIQYGNNTKNVSRYYIK